MNPILQHWHPVCQSKDLGSNPKEVIVGEESIAVFRSGSKIAGYTNQCPHRRMKLSGGKVINGRLECPYHSWSYGVEGDCVKPSGGDAKFPDLLFEGREEFGLVWIRKANSRAEFPVIQTAGYSYISTSERIIHAPLELVLDNFTEVEHTSSVHTFLGFDISSLSKINVELETNDTAVRLFNRGKQKPLPAILRDFLEIREEDDFVDDWTTFFSPVYTVYEQYWIDPKTERERKNKIRIFVFFVPIDKNKTKIFAISYLKYDILGNFGLNLLLGPALSLLTEWEIEMDSRILRSLASQETSLKGTKLTKFDKALQQNRNRIEKVYRQIEDFQN